MKETFRKLPNEKKQRVLNACIREFGEHGYDGSSMDRIIKAAEISKGGIYEYASSKEELFLGTVEYTYTHLYDYLKIRIEREGRKLPQDLLDRLKLTADIAIDFYMDHPHFVYLIVRTSNLGNEKMEAKVSEIFREHFNEIFGDVKTETLNRPKAQILELATWMLQKTRMDFLLDLKTERDPDKIREDYAKNWDFYLDILANGIYKSEEKLGADSKKR